MDECSNCADIRSRLGAPALPLTVVSLYSKPSQLRDWLTYYKGCPEESIAPEPRYAEIIFDLVADFFSEHERTLISATHGWDALAVVPSTDHLPPHPLEAVLAAVPGLRVMPGLLARGPGKLAFRLPAADGFILASHESLVRRVLLVDDVYTTGSRINSAAAALRSAGAKVVGALVIARRVNPDYHPGAKRLWQAQSAHPFDMATSPFIQGAQK